MTLKKTFTACLAALLVSGMAIAKQPVGGSSSDDDSTIQLAGYDHASALVGDDCECTDDGDGCISDCLVDDPWSFSFTQTAGFGTGLALPIAITPDTANGVFEDDFEFLTNSALSRRFYVDDVTTFTTGGGYYQNVHPDVDELDLQAPSVTAQLARQIGERTVAAADYSYSYYFLSGSSFVSQHRIDLSTLRRVSDVFDWKISSGYATADFKQSPILDSDNYSVRGELIRYLDSDRRDYFTSGYAWGRSDAVEDSFSYDVNSVFAGVRTGLDSYDLYTLALTTTYGDYEFEEVDLFDPANVIRRDKIFTGNATISRYLSDSWTTFVLYSYLNSDSNVQRQNYHTNLVAVGVTYAR